MTCSCSSALILILRQLKNGPLTYFERSSWVKHFKIFFALILPSTSPGDFLREKITFLLKGPLLMLNRNCVKKKKKLLHKLIGKAISDCQNCWTLGAATRPRKTFTNIPHCPWFWQVLLDKCFMSTVSFCHGHDRALRAS